MSFPSADNLIDPVPKPTALLVAILRAAHQLLDQPLVFEDPLALAIIGSQEEASLRNDPQKYNVPLLEKLRASVVSRSRLAADEWVKVQELGIRQYVILGAGLDTSAYRNHDSCHIFEVDLPETQRWKRSCLRAAGINEPQSLTFVPIDFERATLRESLRQAQFDPDQPAFFSWLGVSMYIEEEAVLSTLRFIGSLPPGTEVVFDYAVPLQQLSPDVRAGVDLFTSQSAERGEPWKSFFDPAAFVEMLRSLGFDEVEDLDAAQVNHRYFSNRKDGLRKMEISRLICARV